MIIAPPFKIKKKKLKKIAVLTSGGDAPGMNAALRAVVRCGIAAGCKVFGVYRGYAGLIEGQIAEMDVRSVANIIQRGGTIIKTSRSPEFHQQSYRKLCAQILRDTGIEGLVVIGGEGSYAGAHLLTRETGFPTIGLPGTIDNDVFGTDATIGYDTAVNTGLDAIDRVRDTADSHERLFLVEVMGRHCGDIAMSVGLAGGAETIIIPEGRASLRSICASIDRGTRRGKLTSIIVVAEGSPLGGANEIADQLKRKGYSPRVCILGHIQRGGVPTAKDRILATTMGAMATAELIQGRSDCAVSIQKNQLVLVPFAKITQKRKRTRNEFVKLAELLSK